MGRIELKEGYLYKDYNKRGHCKNGTFTVLKRDDKTFVCDTYWSSPNCFEATEDFVKDFEEVFKIDDYRRINNRDMPKYENVIQVHMSQCSGRFRGDLDYFVHKDAKFSKEKVEQLLINKIKEHERILERANKDLHNLRNGKIEAEDALL